MFEIMTSREIIKNNADTETHGCLWRILLNNFHGNIADTKLRPNFYYIFINYTVRRMTKKYEH